MPAIRSLHLPSSFTCRLRETTGRNSPLCAYREFATEPDSNLVMRAILDRLRRTPPPGLPSFVAASTMTSYTADQAVRVAPAAVQREWNINLWGQGFGAFGNVQGDSNAATLDRSTGGFVLGADTTFGERWRAGLAGAFTSTSLDIDGRQSSGSLDSWHIAAYGETSFGALNLRGGAALAHNERVCIDMSGSFSIRPTRPHKSLPQLRDPTQAVPQQQSQRRKLR